MEKMEKAEQAGQTAQPEIWFDRNKVKDVLFCEDFLTGHPMKCIHGTFFDVNGAIGECGLLEEYGGKVLSKMVEKVYIYGDGNLEVMFRNEDYYRMVAVGVKRWQSIILGHLLYQSHLNLEIKII